MKKISTLVPAVVLDWAGTMIDHGCLAPVVALQTVLARHGLAVSVTDARVGMGMAKKDHLRALLTTYGSGDATDELYPALEREVFSQLEPHAVLVAGAAEFSAWLRARGVRLGTSTGYTAEMMRVVAAAAARQGYVPDVIVTPDQVSAGRPAPLMMYANALRLGVWPLSSMVKIGDTPSDIAEGINAGAWTIGVALSGNALGLSVTATAVLGTEERAGKFAAAREALRAAGANYVVDSVVDCPRVIEEIAARIARGERPAQEWPRFS